MSDTEPVAFQIVVLDRPGALFKVASSFRRYNLNIDSITGTTLTPGKSVITITLKAGGRETELVKHALLRNIDVVHTKVIKLSNAYTRELLIGRLKAKDPEIHGLLERHNAKILSKTSDSVLVELVGEPKTINSFIDECSGRLASFSRTGLAVLPMQVEVEENAENIL